MDGVSLARWQQIVDRFELRKGGTNPWDSKKLESNFPGASHHRGMAIKRLLSSTNAKTRFGPRISSSRQGIAIPTRPSSTGSRKMATSFAILERAERNIIRPWRASVGESVAASCVPFRAAGDVPADFSKVRFRPAGVHTAAL